MPKIVTPTIARVQTIGQVKPSQYKDCGYRSVLFVESEYFGMAKDQVPETAKIWQSFDGDDESLESLKKGTWVELYPAGETQQGKTRYNIKLMNLAAPDTAPAAQPAPTPGKLTDEQKIAIAAKVEQNASLFRFCYDTAANKFAGVIDDTAELRAIATTLFIQALR